MCLLRTKSSTDYTHIYIYMYIHKQTPIHNHIYVFTLFVHIKPQKPYGI